MTTRRLALTGSITAAILLLTLAEQISETHPADDLVEASHRLSDTPLTIRMILAKDARIFGNVDVPHHVSEVSLIGGAAGNLIMRRFGDDWYVMAAGKVASDGGAPPNVWMHLDIGGLPELTRAQVPGTEPKQVDEMFATATDVVKFGDYGYLGKIDFTKSPSFGRVTEAGHELLKAVPFDARLNEQGRLTNVVFHLERVVPQLSAATMEFVDVGAPVDVREPLPSETVPMPVTFRKTLGLA